MRLHREAVVLCIVWLSLLNESPKVFYFYTSVQGETMDDALAVQLNFDKNNSVHQDATYTSHERDHAACDQKNFFPLSKGHVWESLLKQFWNLNQIRT